MRIVRAAYRLAHALGRLRHRLPLHGESVWDGAPTDLFLAHLAIYDFCARAGDGGRGCRDYRVLDAGCGTG